MDQVGELRYSYFKKVDGIDYDAFLDYREQAFYALIDNVLERAGRCIAEAYAIYPDDPDLLRLQGEYYLRMGDKERALVAFNEAIRVNPDDLGGYLYRARILHDMGQMSAARIDCEHILSLTPDNLDARCLLVKCYMKLGDMNNAGEQVSEVLQRNPFDIEAITYSAQINVQKAAEMKKKSEAFPKSAFKDLYTEMGRPSFINRTKLFLFVLFKRTWIYLMLILFCQFIIHNAFIEKTGRTAADFAVHYLALKLDSVTIDNVEGLNKDISPAITVKINLTNGKCLDMYADLQEDRNGEITKVYPSFEEAKQIGLYDPNFGYVCMGDIGGQTVIFIGKLNYWAQMLYDPVIIQVQGNVYEMEIKTFLTLSFKP